MHAEFEPLMPTTPRGDEPGRISNQLSLEAGWPCRVCADGSLYVYRGIAMCPICDQPPECILDLHNPRCRWCVGYVGWKSCQNGE